MIENFVVDQRSYRAATRPVLSPGTRTLEFHYAGLSFVAPKKIRFRYRLEGFDEGWIDAGGRRRAYYTNLPPGEYRFQVTASNKDGVWNPEGASIDFRLRPYLYQTGAFYLVSALAIALVGIMLFRYRVRRMRLRQEELETLVADRTGQLEEANRALVELALIDSMTGVANHRHFMERLDEEWRRAIRSRTSLAVVMCDIDSFKTYNDRYGHEAGNLCLRRVAEILTEAIRRPGDLVARYGGDEFVMILCGSDTEGARALAERLPGRVEEEELAHESSDVAPHVTISVGLATVTPTQDFTSDDLIAAADTAMYQAKRDGRNRVRIADPLSSRIQ
jgi:diguanylate cyclase (GGDEF)-like protein